jgi:peptidoglycan/xylan/chitin deacetylase (PgdA/CDA1 family)
MWAMRRLILFDSFRDRKAAVWKILVIMTIGFSIFFSSCSRYILPVPSIIPSPAVTVTTAPIATPSPEPTPTPEPTPLPTPSPSPAPEFPAEGLPVIEGLDTSWIPEAGLAVPDGWTGPIAYLTFDDGPCLGETPMVLSILKTYGIKATFFLIGQKISNETSPVLTAIIENGNTIGNHTSSHLGSYTSIELFRDSVDTTEEKIKEFTGITSRIFRYPGGSNAPMIKKIFSETRQFLLDKGMIYFDWNTSCGDGNNTVVYTSEQLCQNVMLHVGGQKTMIVLMHDSHPSDTDRGRNLLGAVPLIIKALYEKGYRFSTISADTYPVQFPAS